MKKWIFSLCAAVCCVLPALAQQHDAARKANALQTGLQRCVAQALASNTTPKSTQTCPCANAQQGEALSQREIIEAEEELELIRNHSDANATFSKYPYLLDPAYRRKIEACRCQQQATPSQEDEPLSLREQIAAEEELALIRNRQDPHATFEKYPYLLDTTYRRTASRTQQEKIRNAQTQPVQHAEYKRGETWARKVGL